MRTIVKILFLGLLVALHATALGQEKRSLELGAFSRIDLALSATVVLTQGPSRVELEASADDAAKVKIAVQGNTLRIGSHRGTVGSIGTVTVYVQSPNLEGISIAGSGKVLAQGSIAVSDIEIDVAGSGRCELHQLQAAKAQVRITGSGSVLLANQSAAESLRAEITGSGKLQSESYQVAAVTAMLTGSGKAQVHCTERLEAMLTGSGSLYYKGRPQVDSQITGSGRVSTL